MNNTTQLTEKYLQLKADEYKNFKNERSETSQEFIKENIFYIISFSEKDFLKQLKEKGYKPEEVCSLGGAGAFCHVSKLEKVKNFFEDMDKNTQEFLNSSDGIFYGALYYELWNHEYYLSYDNKAVGAALCIDPDTILSKYPLANKVVSIYTEEFEKLNL